MTPKDVLKQLGISEVNSGAHDGRYIDNPGGEELVSYSPIDGKPLARIKQATSADYQRISAKTHQAFLAWRDRPAPARGEIVRQIGEELRRHKQALGRLVTMEMGKIAAEGEGEVQEMIDICDFAVGLSRQLYGLSMHSERARHRMYEQWHPLGAIGVISAFNFPVAVWSWNAAIAMVCGDAVIWKPSSQTPLCAIAVQNIVDRVLERNDCRGVLTLAIGDRNAVGQPMIDDPALPLISATGSTRMGKAVAKGVAARLGRTILELGGNNAVLVTNGADIELATRAVLFGAVGTAGQRCTTTRRLLMARGVATELTERLVTAYRQIPIGDPLQASTLMGPLISTAAVKDMQDALAQVKAQGGEILYGGKVLADLPGGCYVEPTLVKAHAKMEIVKQETFAPILYLIEADSVDDLIAVQNDVPQGLSSAMFTENLRCAEQFLSVRGSDCGIANINIGTSGAEIGGAFGGEKETGGGREAGSDAWKAYMRRQTVTINYSDQLPLAQGIRFGD
ncbi:MAG: aldehyde dehydrogenase family protein [Deltaproteobacteria bacterium]|nr:aldehyde dehydrogenase family protein [Deltaproteobacteria bacterium]